MQIPLSIFLGRVPDDGEPEWTDRDRHVALAWLTYRDSLHDRCGHPLDEAMDPDNEWRRDPDSGLLVPRWSGQIYKCHVCAATDRAYRRHRDAGTDVTVDMDGVVVMVTDRDATGGPDG